jgi:hypothetical protein
VESERGDGGGGVHRVGVSRFGLKNSGELRELGGTEGTE